MKPRLADAELEIGGAGGQGPSELHVETTSPELDGGAGPVFEQQVEEDDAAVVEVDADEIAAAGVHPRNLPSGDRSELTPQAPNPNDGSPVEMDATPSQAVPGTPLSLLPAQPGHQLRPSFTQRPED